MTRSLLFPICSLLISTVVAQPIQTSPTAALAGPLASPINAPITHAYETPAPIPSSQILSKSALKGPGYSVAAFADPEGMLYSFRIDSDYGIYKPQSLQMMRVRLAELNAIARLKELSQEPAFLQGMGKQLEKTVEATGKAIMNPIKTIKKMPDGFKKFAGTIQAQTAVGTVYGESGSPAYAQIKRELAAKLGVDPYTDNLPLQDLLNEVSKNRNRGQLVASLGTIVVGGGAGVALGAVELSQEFQDVIKNKSAQQLQIDNHGALLLKVGCSIPVAEGFLTTPGYTATNCTAITRAMVVLGNIRGVCGLLENLPPVKGPESVLFAQTQIQMAAQFHSTQKPLTAVRFVQGTAVWSDSAGVHYVFSPLDYLYWNEEIDIGMSNIRRELGAAPLEFWITEIVTDTARAELAARGVFVKSNTIPILWDR